ncbi:hypothetical protein CLV30_12576 [Haloactinopolyspora alba]|uniref:Rho termination factor-like protein n=2 Tax=Haloactinopolyspora alba TaxID=648780 RepID=A0A2P8DHJ0_9ACTN|nr:hypothetical protein CLV30_12576 [Haloactinopolyspora alba]
MLHPQSGRVQRASREAFDRVWSHEGWQLTAEKPTPQEPATGEKPLDKLKVPELRAYAADQGIDLGDASKKADILAAIEAATEDSGANDAEDEDHEDDDESDDESVPEES